MSRASRWMFFGLVSLLSLGVMSGGPKVLAQSNAANDSLVEIQVMTPGLDMLRAKQVPFDVDFLLERGWNAKLRSSFDQMPELKTTVRHTGPMQGLILAGNLILPDQVQLSGDTMILARELAPADESRGVMITGPYRLIVFVIEGGRRYRTAPANVPKEFLRVSIDGPCAIVGIPILLSRTDRCKGMMILRN